MALSGSRDADRVNFFQHSHANTRLGIGGVSAAAARLQIAADLLQHHFRSLGPLRHIAETSYGLARDKRLLD